MTSIKQLKEFKKIIKPITDYYKLLLIERELQETDEEIKKRLEQENKEHIKKNKEELKFYVEKYIKIVEKEIIKNPLFLPDNSWLYSHSLNSNLNNLKEDLSETQIKNINRLIMFRLNIKRKGKKRVNVPKEKRLNVFKRDSGICQICEANLNFKNSAWEIDHLNENPADNRLENLRVLCRKCNKKPRRVNK